MYKTGCKNAVVPFLWWFLAYAQQGLCSCSHLQLACCAQKRGCTAGMITSAMQPPTVIATQHAELIKMPQARHGHG